MSETQLSQQQSLRQEQTLSSQQIQSLEFLIAPVLELQQLIAHELEINPLIEAEKNPLEELSGDPISVATEADMRQAEQQQRQEEEFSDISLAEEWKDDLPTYDNVNFDSDQEQQKHDYWLNSLVEQPSLQDQLLNQLYLSDASGKLLRAAEVAVGSIDDRGYLLTHPADIAMAAECDLETAERAVTLLQSFDPPGIGARDLKECLRLQLARKRIRIPLLNELIDRHLDDIGHNRLPQVAKAMNLDLDDLKALLEIIRDLEPHPGNAIVPDHPFFVVPELEVTLDDKGNPEIHGHDFYLPKLRFSQTYLEMLENPETPPETRAYLKEKLLAAQTLLKNLDHRQSTLRRITGTIVMEQHDFFTKGVDFLRPMTMRQVADKLDLHETTVSRAIANKFLATPFGVFGFKFFFAGGYRNADGEDVSTRAIKEKIRDIIAAENEKKPLSDDKISQLLKNDGLDVARRTVAKYREALEIPPTHLRKQH